MPDTREPSRNYKVPGVGNTIAEDFPRLADAITAIGSDVSGLLTSVSQRALLSHSHAIADIPGLQSALDGKAAAGHSHTLDSLSDVAVPNPTAGQLLKFVASQWVPGSVAASEVTGLQAQIDAAVAGLVNGAPGALDTLAELATALGNDPAFSATVSTALGNRLRFDAAQTLTASQARQANVNLGLEDAEVSIASAATVDLTAVKSRNVVITGSVAISSFGTLADGVTYRVRVTGTPTLTQGSGMTLPGGANIVCAAGDSFEVRGTGTAQARVNDYNRASGTALIGPSGTVIDYQVFSTVGAATWTKPSWAGINDLVLIRMWGAGGGGSGGNTNGSGGGGGAHASFEVRAVDLNATESVSVGAGGAGAGAAPAGNGGNSSFKNFIAYGGAGGQNSSGGGGGGPLSAGNGTAGGRPNPALNSADAGGGGGSATGGGSVFGGGGGGSGGAGPGGGSSFFGGGGGAGNGGFPGGASFMGGAGGSSVGSVGNPGSAPGGGGGAASSGTGGAGARGEVRVTVIRQTLG